MTDQRSIETPGEQRKSRLVAKLLIVALACFASGRLGFAIPYLGSHTPLIWLPTGIAVAALMRWGYSCWPGIFLGALATNFSIDSSPLLDIFIGLGDTLGPLFAAWLLRRLQFHGALDRAYDILLLLAASSIGMLISASAEVGSLLILKVLPIHDDGMAWLSWWAGDFVGVLLAAPLLLNISSAKMKKLWAQRVEFLAWSSIMLIVSWKVFFLNNGSNGQYLPLVFMVLAVVVWSAMRFGIAGSSLGVILPVVIATVATSLGLGPFYSADIQRGLFLLWLFTATLVLVDLMVAAMQAERKRADVALQQSELRFRQMFERHNSIMLLIDAASGAIVDANESASRFYGYPLERLKSMNMLQINTNPAEEIAAERARAKREERNYFVFPHRLASGEMRTVEVHASPIVVAGHTLQFSIIHDITARKQMEQQLAASELHLRTIVETEPECVKLLAEDGTVLQMNPAGLRMLGADKPEQIVGQKALGIVAPHHRPAFAALMKRVFEGESGNLEFEAFGLKGTHCWLETYEVPMRDAQGKITAMLGVTRDITGRKASEAKIQQLVNLYAALNQCNQAIVHCTGEEELFPQICRDVVQSGGMKMAWIGLVDEKSKRVYPVAAFGSGIEYLEGVQVSVDAGDPHGRGQAGTAIRENQPVWCQDYLHDPSTVPRHELEARIGWAASASLPLHRNGAAIGAFTVYAAEVNAFNEAARNLLVELATDISYALTRFALLAERRQTEDAMRIAAVTFDTQEAIMITEPDGKILRVNQAFQDITGYSAAEVVGQNSHILQSKRHAPAFYRAMGSTLRDTGKWAGEIWGKRKNGEAYPTLMTITTVYDDNHRVTQYVAVFRDISNRKKSEQAIYQLAFYDPLTHLPNRRLLLDRLHQALAVSARSGRHGALLFLDLDQFKIINDTQGHAMGDQMLIEVARRLQTCVREGDSVARLGGDEFVVVLEDLSSEADEAATQTEVVAEKIRSELGQPYLLKDYECLLTVSIGISLFFEHLESAEDLLQHADVAMYQAKAAERNTIRFFDPHMQTALEARAALEADLRHALEKQQFTLYYQIQADSLRRPLGAEVLLRWEHPERGLVAPEHFIPTAEETGLIVPIGLWVLRTACRLLYEWQNDALTRDLTLAVNVSAKQFRQADFVAQVQRLLLESGAKPSHLKLELTESTVLENVEDTIGKMRELRILGVGFSMDDFGTGYSSLQYLKRLPLNQIKIDQSFVRDIATDFNDAAIVQTIIAMTEALGLDVIAEGVETEAQCEFLDKHGCHAFQGYLFGKPVPIGQFEAILRGG